MLTDPGEGAELREQAARCRRLTDSCLNGRLARILDTTAAEFEEEAERIEKMSTDGLPTEMSLHSDAARVPQKV